MLRRRRGTLYGRKISAEHWTSAAAAFAAADPSTSASGELACIGDWLVAVTTDNVDVSLIVWMREHRYSFPVFQDERGEAGAAFQLYGTPDHVLVDGAGVVRFERLRARELPAYGARWCRDGEGGRRTPPPGEFSPVGLRRVTGSVRVADRPRTLSCSAVYDALCDAMYCPQRVYALETP